MELPKEFISETQRVMGADRFARLLAALRETPPVSIRLNPAKLAALELPLAAQVVAGGSPVPWCPDGFYLSSRPAFTFDPLLHAGAYYVQEASSMFVAHVLRQYVGGPVAMLDMCAAPGGKSSAARSVLPQGSVLVSNEPVRQRAQVLVENMMKWGYADCMVTSNYPQDIRRSGAQFGVILCDVPCSGEGMFRKDPGAIEEWSLQNVERCWRLQREIVAEAWQCLVDGGLMVYSTCTFNTKENEENVRWIEQELGGEVLRVDIDEGWGITGSLLPGYDRPVYRFLPGYTVGEGLFMAVVRKRGHLPRLDEKAWRGLIGKATPKLNMLYDGQPQSERKGKTLVPAHAQALSLVSGRGQYEQAELGYAAAMAYLRGEAIQLPPCVSKGYVMVTFHGLPLGFVKNIGNRANNLYPKEWRIKSTHIPQEYEAILRLA